MIDKSFSIFLFNFCKCVNIQISTVSTHCYIQNMPRFIHVSYSKLTDYHYE